MNEKIKQMFMMKRPQSEICDVITKYLIKKYNFLSIDCNARDNEIYVYRKEEGIYTENGRMIIRQECERLIGSFIKTHMVNEIINKVERKTYSNRNIFFNAPLKLVCIENGILNLLTKKLINHTPDIIFTNKLPLTYNEYAYCHNFLTFLGETLYEEDLLTCQEWFGYLLWKRYHEKKALVSIGQTDTGKTVFLSTIINFLGKGNISSVDLHEITPYNRFAAEHLYNKYVNICDELTSNDLKDVSKFKKLTGRSKLDAEPKFKDKFTFENFAKFVFATNKMPILQGNMEDPESYYNRWIIFLFDNKVEEKDKDKELIEKLGKKEELSGILNWALIGLKRLLDNKEFTLNKSWEENEKIMKSSGESVYSFSVNGIELYDGFTGNDIIYEKYIEYCNMNNKIVENQISFGRKFKPKVGKRINDGTKNGWKGIKPKEVLLDIN